ncbi:MAG: hypothetical protein IJW97_07120 [Clostridia bacterium]|nr:hypothetical protein [Clostridia bacterium]
MKNGMLLRLLALMLAMLMVLGSVALVSCADDQDKDEDKDPVTDPEDDTSGDDATDPEDERLPLDLPDANYNGAEVHFLEWSAGGQVDVGYNWIPWEDIAIEDYDGDILNTAIYERNSYVEETYGVTITKEYKSVDQDYGTALRNNAKTDDDEYQAMTMRTLSITSFILEELMANMYEMDNIHSDMPWWNQDSVASFTLGSTLYFAAPELLLRDKGAAAALYYNSQIAIDHGIDDLYDLAKAGEWTWEHMIEYCEQVSASLDADELMNSMEDRWGLIGSDSDVFRIFSATGFKFAHIDEDGLIAYDFGDEESILKMQEVFENFIYADFFAHNELLPSGKFSTLEQFMNDRGLFAIGGVRSVNQLRSMETDYGVLPIPKYDEDQEDYASLVWVHDDSALGILAAAKNPDMVALVVEAMSYYSWYNVYPKFYDTVILGKSTRDQQSKEMLEIVFRTRLYDPGQYWDSGTGCSGIQTTYLRLPKTGESNIASIWESYKSAVEIRFEDINSLIEESMQ